MVSETHSSQEVAALQSENAVLRHRLSLLGRLSYRVASSLDLGLVLQEVVDAACALTDARYGALALVGPSGEFERLFVHGLSDEERGVLGELPHGRGILGALHAMNGPLRLASLKDHEQYVGFPAGHPTMTTFLGMNIQDRDVVQGSLYLSDKNGADDFSPEDEELLTLFTQQAAAAIRNARLFKAEHAARSDAEAARRTIGDSRARLLIEMKELKKLRVDLLAAIAHEFKTPLTAIRTAVGVLRDPTLSIERPQEKRLLGAISESAALMQRLVTDFVDLGRFQSGAIQLEVSRFNARVIANAAVRSMSALFESRDQTIVLDAPKQPLWVHGDRRRLEQALINLLSNAQKFAPEGSTITVKMAAENGDVLWTVIDSGPGIPAAAQPYLFDRFFTLPEGDSGKSSGTGLGLAIAIAIARLHDGTIQVKSAPGAGSAFTLRIVGTRPNGGEG